MLKGLDLIKKIKYELKHNLDYTNQSVKVPKKDLESLIQLAESNQYRLDDSLVKELMHLHQNQCHCKKNH